MRVIVTLASYAPEMPPQFADRPHALLNLAGNTILGHILNQVGAVMDSLLCIVDAQDSGTAAWIAANYPDLPCDFVTAAKDSSETAVYQSALPYLTDEPVLLVQGHYVVEADWDQVATAVSDAVCFVQSDDDPVAADQIPVNTNGVVDPAAGQPQLTTGVVWFRSGWVLRAALETPEPHPADNMSALMMKMAAQGQVIESLPAYVCVDTRTTEALFHANRRLLGLGYGSQDAIERSYADDFTVLPPVFIHETAVVEHAVIGPFVNIEAGTVVRRAIVANSFIGAGAQIENCVLENSMIGLNARVNGRVHTLNVKDDDIRTLHD